MVIDDILRNDGATLDGATLEPVRPVMLGGTQTGYAVAIAHETAMKVRVRRLMSGRPEPELWRLSVAIRSVRDTFHAPFVGVWIDPAGVAHVDPVVILPDLASARIIAHAFSQNSIFDFNTNTVLVV